LHEALLSLIRADRVPWKGRKHFYVVASKIVKRVLVDRARRRKRAKRGGGAEEVPLEEHFAVSQDPLDLILYVNEALDSLASQHPRKARAVELRFFGQLTHQDIAELLQIPCRHVDDDWQFARAWLRRDIEGKTPHGPADH